MCISNELYCFEVKQNNPVELHTQALSAQSSESGNVNDQIVIIIIVESQLSKLQLSKQPKTVKSIE